MLGKVNHDLEGVAAFSGYSHQYNLLANPYYAIGIVGIQAWGIIIFNKYLIDTLVCNGSFDVLWKKPAFLAGFSDV